MRRWIVRITLAFATVALAGFLYVLGTMDSHHLNLRYILWKHHAWPFQRFMLAYLNVDGDFNLSLEGKTKADIQRYFPVLIPPERAVNDYQKFYSRDMIEHHADCLWIDDSGYAVQFQDGKVVYVGPIKG